jgi:hypothetical protein
MLNLERQQQAHGLQAVAAPADPATTRQVNHLPFIEASHISRTSEHEDDGRPGYCAPVHIVP